MFDRGGCRNTGVEIQVWKYGVFHSCRLITQGVRLMGLMRMCDHVRTDETDETDETGGTGRTDESDETVRPCKAWRDGSPGTGRTGIVMRSPHVSH